MNVKTFETIQEHGNRKLVRSFRAEVNPDFLFDNIELSESTQRFCNLDNVQKGEVFSRFVIKHYGYGGYEIYLERYRWETDEEWNERKKEENKLEERRIKQRKIEEENKKRKLEALELLERAELKRLLDKYEPGLLDKKSESKK